MQQENDEERYEGGYQNSTVPLSVEQQPVSFGSSSSSGHNNRNNNIGSSNNSNSNSNHSFGYSATSSIASEEEEGHNDADLLARKLMACNDNDDLEKIVLRRSLDIPYQAIGSGGSGVGGVGGDINGGRRNGFGARIGMGLGISAPAGGKGKGIGAGRHGPLFVSKRSKDSDRSLLQNLVAMISIAVLGLAIIFVLLQISTIVAGPPREPVGPYKLIEFQEAETFFNSYVFYNGVDSEGSKGYVNYVTREKAHDLNIANVTYETIDNSIFGEGEESEADASHITDVESHDSDSSSSSSNSNGNSPLDASAIGDDSIKGSRNTRAKTTNKGNVEKEEDPTEPFIYMSTSPTKEGPRNSVRLEGLRRFNRGLFILDLRHMPSGCATWPAFWLTDEPNWPVNGEIDILEGVNLQTQAKTALHTTHGCNMEDVPLGVNTGTWDTAIGVPKKNGDLDMTMREAKDCFVYNPHQWLNQGCVAIDEEGTLGEPLNDKGGGVFVLEWDPINRFIKSWVFAPHSTVPENLRKSLQAANDKESQDNTRPNPETWGLPYAYYPIGKGTNCPSDHFKNMHIIFNLALCGTVAGNRFFMDCPLQNEKYGSCDNYVKANTPEMDEVYWKIRGVYIYEREWERAWVEY